jgi:hypothetical protein
MAIKVKHLSKRRRITYSNHKLHPSYEERINYIKEEIEKLEKLKKINDYFKHVSRRKNSYLVEMRRIIVKGLLAQNFTLAEVTRAVGLSSHATVLHLINVENFEHIKKEVIHNYQRWMADMVYPVTYTKVIVDPDTKHRRGVLDYKLKPIRND